MSEFLDAFSQHWGWAWLIVGIITGLFLRLVLLGLED